MEIKYLLRVKLKKSHIASFQKSVNLKFVNTKFGIV